MGAKQSKRSVDISGKEAENAGEVAAAGAGGEGRMEVIADVDNLKPQLNGDTPHIQNPDEKSDKEKQLENGTPENEKDSTTEKESKEKEVEESAPVVANGDAEEKKEENGETTPAVEEKKPKKEKVKKKWSLRSISFSRKDKPKHEKKQKDEEAKTNGEPEKVPEEAAEAVAAETKAEEDATPKVEKAEETVETPVTEPITNGSSTPESKVESPPAEDIKLSDRPKEVKEPELPINGLSLEESIKESTEVIAETVEKVVAEQIESSPVTETPVKTEVCVERMNSIESTPPPLPANPPPSSVATFAVTTMAPELTDALVNTTEIAPPAEALTESNNICQDNNINTADEIKNDITEIVENQVQDKVVVDSDIISEPANVELPSNTVSNESFTNDVTNKVEIPDTVEDFANDHKEIVNEEIIRTEEKTDNIINGVIETNTEFVNLNGNSDTENKLNDDLDETAQENIKNIKKDLVQTITNTECNGTSEENHIEKTDTMKEVSTDIIDKEVTKEKTQVVASDIIENEVPQEKAKVVASDCENEVQIRENGLDKHPSESELESLPAPSEELLQADENEGSNDEASESFPLPPAELSPAETTPPPQESLPIVDKISELIPEVPVLPTETATETTTDVAVAN